MKEFDYMEVIMQLQNKNVTGLIISYSGGGDSGCLDSIHFSYKEHENLEELVDHYQDGNTNRNANAQNTMELFWTNLPATNWVASIWFWNVGNTTKQNKLESSIMKAKSDGNSAYLAHGAINNETNNLNKIIETQFFFTAGDVDEYAYQLYGVSA